MVDETMSKRVVGGMLRRFWQKDAKLRILGSFPLAD